MEINELIVVLEMCEDNLGAFLKKVHMQDRYLYGRLIAIIRQLQDLQQEYTMEE